MDFSDITDIATAGLRAQRARMTVTASNIANAQTTRTEEGGPYRRRDPVFSRRARRQALRLAPRAEACARSRSTQDRARTRASPSPDTCRITRTRTRTATSSSRTSISIEEQANLVSSSRSFQANLLVISKVRSMAEALMRIGQ